MNAMYVVSLKNALMSGEGPAGRDTGRIKIFPAIKQPSTIYALARTAAPNPIRLMSRLEKKYGINGWRALDFSSL